jgi:hypothetical protein
MPCDVSVIGRHLEQEVSRSGAGVSHFLPPLASRPPASGQRCYEQLPENQARIVTDPLPDGCGLVYLPRAGMAASR